MDFNWNIKRSNEGVYSFEPLESKFVFEDMDIQFNGTADISFLLNAAM